MTKLVTVKTADGTLLAAVLAPGGPDENGDQWATILPANHKDDDNLQGPAVPQPVGPGTPYEIVD